MNQLLKDYSVSLKSIMEAEKIVYQWIKPTPLVHYKSLSDVIGTNCYVKHENHLLGGSFKIRGGLTIMHELKQQGIEGVITFSTGNHGISIATAAKQYGIKATIVVPEKCNKEKNERIKDTGATLVEAGVNFEEAAIIGAKIQQEQGLYYIHPANTPQLINGVATGFLEVIRELPDLDAAIIPIGGGSELAAAVTVFKAINPKIEIYAVQAEASQGAYLSWQAGKIVSSSNKTFAGGIATGSAYDLPFSIYKNQLTDFVLLSEEEISRGIYLALSHTHNLAEAAGAAAIVAAEKIKDRLVGKKVVLQMSGCNETMECVQKSLKQYL